MELSGRCGFAATGSSSGPKTAVLNSFLRNAQWQIYWTFDLNQMKEVFVFNASSDPSLGQDQQYIDYPDNLNPSRVLSMASSGAVTLSTPNLQPMKEGIGLSLRNSRIRDRPRNYELRSQMEIWPVTDQAGYSIRMEYVKRLERFTVDSDQTSIPAEHDDLILLHAIANAKAHYRHPDASGYVGQLNSSMRRIAAKEATSEIFVRGEIPDLTDTQHKVPLAQGGIENIT